MRNARIAVITQAVKLADEAAGLNRTSYIAELLAQVLPIIFVHSLKHFLRLIGQAFF